MIKMDKNKKSKIQKKTPKIFNTILSLLVIIAIISLSSLAIQKVIFKDDVPSLFGYKILQVMSGSMSGTFETGDLIIVKEVKKESELKIGDIITFKTKDTIVTHRIIDITKSNERLEFTTKGDANSAKDADKVAFNNIEGKYIVRVAFLGKILNMMQTPIGMTIVVILPILIIVLLILQDRKKERKQIIRKEKRLKFEFEEKMKEKK